MSATVDAIFMYPVKSMQGSRLDEAVMTDAGLAGDRAYALVDRATGRICSAKNPRKWGSLLELSAVFVEPLAASAAPPPVRITHPDGSDVRSDDPRADAVLSSWTGGDVSLIARPPEQPRYEAVWPDIPGAVPATFIEQTMVEREPSGDWLTEVDLGGLAPAGSFFDVASLHLLTTSTLAALAERCRSSSFDPRRYRPNILVRTDSEGFVENDWAGCRVAIGDDVVASVAFPTMRCVMTTLAQGGLPRDREVLRASAVHNHIDIPGLGGWACAGVYATVAAAGRIAVGDSVVVSRG